MQSLINPFAAVAATFSYFCLLFCDGSLAQAEVPSDSAAASSQTQDRLQVDNVNYTSAAYYARSQDSDKNDRRTEATAFANPQKSLDVSRPAIMSQ